MVRKNLNILNIYPFSKNIFLNIYIIIFNFYYYIIYIFKYIIINYKNNINKNLK